MVKLTVFKFLKGKKGFTATELLVVTTLLSSIPVTSFIG
ncbi:prepilin-type N-terminal cleavage/methylation domain-containing protein, partial [Candidatus Calescamantes bacterium]|nr:prepilin-type N-terminal cleavage/methylation domain-containing protein [Candidatus Calescamantes bacterium]